LPQRSLKELSLDLFSRTSYAPKYRYAQNTEFILVCPAEKFTSFQPFNKVEPGFFLNFRANPGLSVLVWFNRSLSDLIEYSLV